MNVFLAILVLSVPYIFIALTVSVLSFAVYAI